MSTVTIDNLQAAKNGDELVQLLDKAGIELSLADDTRLVAATKDNFTSKRRTVVRTMRSAKFFKADGSVDDAVVAQPDKVSQWFTKLMAELEPLDKSADKSEKTDESTEEDRPNRVTKSAKSWDNWVHAALGTGILTEIAAEFGASRIDDALSGRHRDSIRLRDPEGTADMLEAEARVVGRASKSLTSRVMSSLGTALQLGLIALAVISAFVIGFIVFWPITIPMVILGWMGYRGLDRRARRNMLRWVGEDLPTVLRLSRVKWIEFCDPDQPEKWQKVYNRAMEHLDSKLPWHNSREDRIDNLLFELTARINRYYHKDGLSEAENLARAAKVMDAPDAQVPEAVYRINLGQKDSVGSSLLSRYLEHLKSA